MMASEPAGHELPGQLWGERPEREQATPAVRGEARFALADPLVASVSAEARSGGRRRPNHSASVG